jgi:hypothetical protein
VDQVKQVMQVLFNYRFWLICGVITIIPIGGWWSSTSQLQSDFKDRKSEIDGKFTTGGGIRGEANHPNTYTADGMDQYIGQLKSDVLDAWRRQYQKQDDLLKWPSELRPDFIRAVDQYRPIESFADFVYPPPPEAEISVRFRERYRDYIKQELPKLADIIGAVWRAQAGAAGMSGGEMGDYDYGGASGMGMSGMGMPGMGGMGMPSSGGPSTPQDPTKREIVAWSANDQSLLQNGRFDWSSYPDKAPKTLDVLYAQEDLWVLNAIMQIIARTNRDATARYNAVVKEIRYISLGRTVGRGGGRVMRVRGSAGGMGGMGSMGMYGDEDMGGEYDYGGSMGSGDMESDYYSEGMEDMESDYMSGSSGMGEMGMGGPGMTRTVDPANNRYVDNDYNPIASDRLRTALSPGNRNPGDAFLVVAKRIPVRMGFVMDQRKVHRLIAACGNADLMVEVRQVRINRQGAAGASGMMGGSMGGGMMGGMGPGAGMMAPGSMGGGMMGGGMDDYYDSDYGSGGEMGSDYGGGPMGGPGSDKSPHDLPVEVYGMVYIYNPVDMDKLGIEQIEADDVPASPTAPTDTPTEPAAAGEATTS